jgi:curved DNA-binding protein CbpA
MTDPPAGESSPLSWKTRDRYRTSRPPAAPTAEEVEELGKLRLVLENMGRQDDFAMLGIAQGSTAEAAAAAFLEMARRYHPDLYARYDDPAIKQTATEIFVLLRHASARIRDHEMRRAKEQPAAPKQSAHDAQPGDGRLSSAPPMTTEERFAEALRHAAHHRNREAELLLLIALADQPGNVPGKVWLLTVQARQAKAAGKLDEAAAGYEAVLRLDPHNVEATYELHSLPGAWRRTKASFGRLWKRGGTGG